MRNKLLIPSILLLLLLLKLSVIAQTPQLMLPIGHTSQINSVEYSSDGKFILTASVDNTIKLWSASTGDLLRNLISTEIVNFAIFNPDHSLAVAGLSDNSAEIWDLKKGKLIRKIRERTEGGNGEEGCIAASFSQDGKYLLIVSEFNIIKAWETATGKLVKDLTFLKGTAAAFTARNDIIISSPKFNGTNYSEQFNVFKLKEGKLSSESPQQSVRLKGYHDKDKALPDSTLYVLTQIPGNDLSDKLTSKNISEHKYSSDSTRLALIINDGTVVVYDLSRRSQELILHDMTNAGAITFSADSKKLAVTEWNAVTIWEISTGRLTTELTGHSLPVKGFAIDPSGEMIAAINGNTVSIWDYKNARLNTIISHHADIIHSVKYGPDGKLILTASADSSVAVFDAATGKLKTVLKIDHDPENAFFTRDGKYIITSPSYQPQLWSLDGELISDIIGTSLRETEIRYTNDGKYFYTVSGNELHVWELKTGNIVFEEEVKKLHLNLPLQQSEGMNEYIGWASVTDNSADGKYVLAIQGEDDPVARVFERATGKLYKELRGHTGVVITGAFSPDSRFIVTGGSDNKAILWDLHSGRPLHFLNSHFFYVSAAEFTPDGNYVLTAAVDNTMKLWSVRSGKELVSWSLLDSADYLFRDPDGYYTATRTAARLLHYVTNDLRIISFQQLDVKFNRPDKILSVINSKNKRLIAAYETAWKKRISRLHIDSARITGNITVPEADFQKRNSIPFEQFNKDLTVSISADDKMFFVDRFNIWVNDVPLFGLNGTSVKKKKSGHFDTTISIELNEGLNVLETSVTNINGIESYRMPLSVNYRPATPVTEKLFFIGLGIDSFKQQGYNLNYSVKDIKDMAIALREKYKDNIVIDTLFNERFTVDGMIALKQRLKKTATADKVIVAYSGHGLLGRDLEYYLSNTLTDFQHPEQTGLPYNVLESLIDSIPARKKLMLIDACHSGEIDKEEMKKYREESANLRSRGIRGIGLLNLDSTSAFGTKNSFELMQELFVNVGKSTGATIISAAAGTQLALEKGDLKNGVFTYSILEFMQSHPTATVSELKAYVNKRVPELTNGLQVPTARSENLVVDWKVW